MRPFLELFAIPVLVAALVNLVTNNLRLPGRIRVPVVVVLGLVALVLVNHLRSNRINDAVLSGLHEDGASRESGKAQPRPGPIEPVANVGRRSDADSPPASIPTHSVIDYIGAPPRHRGSPVAWTVLIHGEDGRDYPVIRAAVQQAISSIGVSTPSLFRASTSDEAYEDIFAANVSTLDKLKPFCDGLVVGRVKLNTSPSDQFSGMFTAHLDIDVKLISVSKGPQREFVIDENGAGFSPEDSQLKAEQRLAEKLRIELAKFPFK